MAPKCDMAKPECSRCRASSLVCEGYARDCKFVNSYLIGNGLLCGNAKSTRPQEQTRPGHLRIQAATPENSQADIALSDSLVRTARQQLYLEHLWAVMFPKDHHFLTESRLSAPGWSGLVLMFYNTEPSLRCVTLAMAMACLATENNDEQLRLKSLQTYNSAVQELGSALKQRQAYQRNGLIVASGLMASFEVCSHPKRNKGITD